MGIFGWDLPPDCSIHDIPGNQETELIAEAISEGWRMKCEKCHSFISFQPTRSEPWEETCDCDGSGEYCDEYPKPHAPHKVVWNAGFTFYHVCKRCGHETKVEDSQC